MAIDTVIPGEPLSQPSAEADDLTAMNEPDLLANEQTWPTEEDMQGAEELGSTMDDAATEMRLSSKAAGKRKVKAGGEGHQASWLIYAEEEDEENREDDDDDDDDDDGMDEDGDNLGVADGFGGGDGAEVDMNEEMDSRRSDGHEDLDDEEEERQ